MAQIDLGFFGGLTVAVLGLGKSGLSAARALSSAGAEVWAWDDNKDSRQRAASEGLPIVDLHDCDWSQPVSLILSPGIPHSFPAPHEVVELARHSGCEIISDIELLARAQRGVRFVGITGTNGKSTTTTLIGHILKQAGRPVAVGGNLGVPALELEALTQDGIYVLEMSSYQLEITRSITFDIAVLMNISPDHLDRHGGFDGYVAAKKLIFHRQARPCTAIVGTDDDTCRKIFEDLSEANEQNIVPISGSSAVKDGVYVAGGILIDNSQGDEEQVLDLRDLPNLPGEHNAQNAAAAYAVAVTLGVSRVQIVEGLKTFGGLEHRQEMVAEIDGVRYVNDSKATNADAAARALACYDLIYWIAGGRAKEGGLDGLESFYPRIAEVFLIGEAETAFASVLEGRFPVKRCGTLAKAVSAAAAAAKAAHTQQGSSPVVLLSPACASFDQFPSFEARGTAFKAAVAELHGSQPANDDGAAGQSVGGDAA
ncbi:UDP-N-acetylmuramoyl-L-alanine--D-glutamate ligase [Denitrobaculum tricleocarpae]|uniref:UDP-N-acetylmuramoylalanine--D-glutamate ligase n=1 Tax=Denitrobaculum tricleocarpae TaxID=2591009 RepID=A0A545T0T7_9PROT|nr:UDP-N-acetylmuramoyl-L-alanine--D-glutamate ligase [Denitrobaculum tricleocarpae]TQV70834.1 UDP-N-acetylmuramoyl-L-alanine--D-glutamate ligase [Denitrobaculum tricleocarpae]